MDDRTMCAFQRCECVHLIESFEHFCFDSISIDFLAVYSYYNAIDPCAKLCNICVNARDVSISASNSPRDDANENSICGERSSRIALARVFAATRHATAEHYAFFEPLFVGALAFRI